MMLTREAICDHDLLCRLDVLGTEDSPTGDQMYVYQEIKEQLECKANEFTKLHYYETPDTHYFTATKMEAYQN